MPGTAQYGLPVIGYIIACVGYSMIYTCLYNNTRGSVLIASLYHAAGNAIISFVVPMMPFIVNQLYLSLPAVGIVALLVMRMSRCGAKWAEL
jgi:hypothetical protein